MTQYVFKGTTLCPPTAQELRELSLKVLNVVSPPLTLPLTLVPDLDPDPDPD